MGVVIRPLHLPDLYRNHQAPKIGEYGMNLYLISWDFKAQRACKGTTLICLLHLGYSCTRLGTVDEFGGIVKESASSACAPW